MKVTRLLTSVLCFLLIINFFRTINGAGNIGSSDVLQRLNQFDLDLTPIYNLVEIWEENDYGNIGDKFSSGDVLGDSTLPSPDTDPVPLVGPGGGGSSGGVFGEGGFYDPGEDASWIEKAISAIGYILEKGWDSIKSIGSITEAITSKIELLFSTVKYLFTNGISLLMLPVHLLSETFSFSFWLLGFGT